MQKITENYIRFILSFASIMTIAYCLVLAEIPEFIKMVVAVGSGSILGTVVTGWTLVMTE